MDIKNSKLFQNLVLIFLVLNLLVCPFMFIGSLWAPGMIQFLEPVVCPDGMEIEFRQEQRVDSEGDNVVAGTTHCGNGREFVDVTWKTTLIMLGFPILGVVVFLIAPTKPPKEKEGPKIDPDAFK